MNVGDRVLISAPGPTRYTRRIGRVVRTVPASRTAFVKLLGGPVVPFGYGELVRFAP
jgi:hypothetical protein